MALVTEIKPISIDRIEPYFDDARKERLTFIPNVEYFGAFSEEKIVGFCGIKWKEKHALSKSIFVLPHYRKQGVGKDLISYTLNLAKEKNKSAVVASCTVPSLPIFIALGAVITKQYKSGALVMVEL